MLWRTGTQEAPDHADVKTVRRYIAAAESAGLVASAEPSPLGDESLASVLATLAPETGRPHGDAQQCIEERDERSSACSRSVCDCPTFVGCYTGAASTSPIRRYIASPSPSSGSASALRPFVADGEPGEELPDERDRRRRFRA
jgi:hypothetical protein